MWQHVFSISCSQAFFTTDIWTHCRKSTGDTNNINDGSVIICTTPGSWNWSSYMEFNHHYSLLFTPVLFLLQHVKMSAVIKACWVVAWMCSSWVWSCRKTLLCNLEIFCISFKRICRSYWKETSARLHTKLSCSCFTNARHHVTWMTCPSSLLHAYYVPAGF